MNKFLDFIDTNDAAWFACLGIMLSIGIAAHIACKIQESRKLIKEINDYE